MTSLSAIIDHVGASNVAGACGVSAKAVYKWRKKNALPRTEYTNETCYAEKIASLSGGAFSAQHVLECGRPVSGVQ